MPTTRRLRLAILAAALVVLLAQSIGAGLLIERARDASLASAQDTANRISRAVETSINRNFVQVDAMLAGLPTVLGPYAEDGRFDAAGASRVLRELNNQNFTFRDVLLVGQDGMPIATGLALSRRRPLPLPLGPAFVETGPSAGGVAIGGPVRNPANGEWALFFARPVTMPALGVVTAVAEVPTPVVAGLLAIGGEVPGLRVTLERDDGTLLAALPHDETRVGRRLSPPATAMADQADPRSRFTDQAVLVAVRPTLYPNLLVTATIENEAALIGWHADRERAMMLSGAFFGFPF